MFLIVLMFLKFVLFTSIVGTGYANFSTVLTSGLIAGLFLSYIYSRQSKARGRYGLIFYSLVSIIMAVDAIYYMQFNSLPSILALKQLGQLSAVTDSVINLFNWKVILMLVDLPIFVYLYIGGKTRELFARDFYKKSMLGLSILLAFNIGFLYISNELPVLRAQELFIYHASDIKDTVTGTGDRSNRVWAGMTEEDLDIFKERGKVDPDNKYSGIVQGRNLIVLQIEGLQDFVVGLDYEDQEVTPHINSLIQEDSLYFSDYHQLLGRGNTSDAEFVTNNSLHPSMEEPTYSQYANNSFYGLPWILGEYGYESYVFHGFEREFWNRKEAYPNQGFKKFFAEDDFEFDPEDIIGFGIKDEDFYQQTVDYLVDIDEETDDPFYAFVVSLSCHTPFKMPDEYNWLELNPDHEGNMVGDYLNSAHYADYAIGLLLEDLKEAGLYDNSVIALYGDHFGITVTQDESDLVGRDILGRDYDYDDMMRIPLVIHMPGSGVKEEVKEIGSQIDFLPTILNLFGYESDKSMMVGRDLVNLDGEDNFVAPQTYMLKGSFITDDLLFEFSRDGFFTHSRLLDRGDRAELDLDRAHELHERVREEIERSNYILVNDYFKSFLKDG